MQRIGTTHDGFPVWGELLTTYADSTGDETAFVIPEDLTVLSDEELAALHEQAATHFDAVYGDGSGLAQDDLDALGVLTQGIEALSGEVANRQAAQAERDAAAAQLASRARPADQSSTIPSEGEADPADDPDEDEPPEDEDEDDEEDPDAPPKKVKKEKVVESDPESAETVVAAGRGPLRVTLPTRSRHRPAPAPTFGTPTRMQDMVLAAADVPGMTAGQGMNWDQVGRAIDRRLTTFNHTAYANAHRQGRHLREQHGVAVLHKPIDPELMITSTDRTHVDEVLRRAMDEHRLPGGSLVASGGWCAPSETIYTLCELESRDGMFSLPEIGIARGGIQWTLGPNFADIYAVAQGFHYTEQEDIDGDYDGAGGGSKPCFRVDCPDFTEARLELDGICIQAGLLQSRGYPEYIARTTRGALIAHDHRLSGALLAQVEAGSTPVAMPTDVLGATAPLLEAIDLQVEHYRSVTRISRSATLEAVFPFWITGVIRADLSRRLGIDLLDVSNARIAGWFSQRGISPQYVYNWQDIGGGAAAFTKWPATVKFLLYSAGTWVRGTSDVITLDTIYDSVLLGTNDYTALFTEEGSLVAKMCHDSRVVTVTLCPNGATGAGVAAQCDGTVTA